ncbi:MAG: hypothetical protein HON90_14355 [Halobacteriovoraceae bacterium]|nr:hypothetical protein [Halobacteriovoraceae bacterium]
MSKCRYCNKEITWLKEGRKNVPVESDGAKHDCENFKSARNSYCAIEPSELDPDILKQYQENMDNALKTKK